MAGEYESKDARDRKTVNPISQHLTEGISIAERNRARREEHSKNVKESAGRGKQKRAERKARRAEIRASRKEKREKIKNIRKGVPDTVTIEDEALQESYDVPASGETEVTEENVPGGIMDVIEGLGETEVTEGDLYDDSYWSDEAVQGRIDDFENSVGETVVTDENAPGGSMEIINEIIDELGETEVTEDNMPDYEGETEVADDDLMF